MMTWVSDGRELGRCDRRLASWLFAGLGLLCFAVVSDGQEGAPSIEFAEKTYDFGKVLAGKKVTHAYQFRNVGNADLTITKVSTSCGCTAALPSKTLIPPGEGGEIEVEFDTTLRSGLQSKSIKVTTNDPRNETVRLLIEGHVTPIVEAEPNYIGFSSAIRRGTGAVKGAKLFTTLKRSFRILRATSNVPGIVAAYAPYEREGEKGYVLTVRLKPDAEPGEYSGRITIALDHPQMETYDLPFYAKVWGYVLPEPPYFVFGQIEKGEEAQKVVTLSKLDRPFKVTSVKTPEGPFEVETRSLEGGMKTEVVLKVRGNAPAGRLEGKVVIETDVADDPPIELQVYGRVKGGGG